MAIVQVGSTTTDFDAGTPTSLTTSYTQAAGSDLVLTVYVSTEGSVGHSTVTFNSVGLTKQADSVGSGRRTTIWTLVNPDVVTANIVVSLASSADVSMIATSWSGVDQSTPVSSSATNSGSGNPTVTVSSASGELVTDNFCHDDSGSDPLVGAGQTELADVEVTGDFRTAHSREDGAAPNVTMSWTMLSGQWSAAAISLQPSGAPAPVDQTHQMML